MFSVTPKDEPDTFGQGYHGEWITAAISNGGDAALMVSFDDPQRIAIRYNRPDELGGDVIVQSIGVGDLLSAWVAGIDGGR